MIRKRLLRGAIHKRCKEKSKLEKVNNNLMFEIRKKFQPVDWHILTKSIERNVDNATKTIIETHAKKLRNLTKNNATPFKKDDVITNLSSYVLSDEENDLLQNGLSFGLQPKSLSKTDIFTTFEMISRFATSKLKKEDMTGELKSELSHLANTYYNSYKPSRDSLKKHGTLKKLKNNKDIVITKPDKGNGVVIMDRKSYIEKMLNILSDPSKFRKLDVDPTLKREGQLQRFLRTLKGSKFINSSDYEKIYPKGSKCARMYGLPKLHKVFSRLDVPP